MGSPAGDPVLLERQVSKDLPMNISGSDAGQPVCQPQHANSIAASPNDIKGNPSDQNA